MAHSNRSSTSRITRPDGLHVSTREGSDTHPRPAMSPSFSVMSLPSVNPEPAYIAPTAAATIVSSELEGELGLPVYDEHGHPIDGAMVSPNSLSLVNSFLDRLLFNFLSYARSTTLASLRPAIIEVLKPRLAKDAIAGADEELHEYLGGDDDELNAFHGGQDTPRDWDLDLVWRRARLRCMVYTRLGDMEEEDEEMYIEQEHLDDYDQDQRVAREMGMVSPAVAIFLTSILEFVGEHALIIATHAAFKRIDARARAEAQLQNRVLQGFPRVSVEETDVEKIALNANLGRLWRGWRKQIRSPRDSGSSRAFRGFGVGSGSRKSSVTASDMHGTVPSVAEILEPDPTLIPLPMTEHDVDEIEVPGYSAERTIQARQLGGQLRPASLLVTGDWLRAFRESAPGGEEAIVEGDAEVGTEDEADDATPVQGPVVPRIRSQSLPPQAKRIFEFASDIDSEAFETPEEELSQRQVEERREAASVPDEDVARKPISEPATPSYGSVLNVLSRHVARELQKSPPGANLEEAEFAREEVDPADGALTFTGNDYIINEHERAAIESQRSRKNVPSINLPRSTADSMRVSAVSPIYPESSKQGDVSPMGQEHLLSGEVSPIEPSDDEMLPTSRDKLYNEPVSPLVEQHHEIEPLQAPPNLRRDIPAAQPSPAQPSPGTPTARQRKQEDSTAKDENREAFIVAAPSPLRSHPSNVPPVDAKRSRPQPADVTGAAPNLAPLREMVEAAPDSDEASSVEPSEFEPQHISKRNASKPLKPIPPKQTTKPKPLPPPGPGVEKAAVQRMTPDAPSRNSASMSNRTSDVPTQVPNSQSMTEKAKNRITSSGLRGSMTSRLSGEGKISDERYSRSSGGTSERQKEFEDLMASEETIQYTLTPQNMRNIEERKSYVIMSPTQGSVKSPVSPQATRGPRAQRQSSEQPPSYSNVGPAPPPKPHERAPSGGSGSGQRVVSGVPREARVPRSNTQDFADFIRSTGPENAANDPPQLNKQLPSVSTRSSQIAKSQGRFRTSKGGERLQARDAQVRRSQNDELIALLNQGPPSETGAAGATGAMNRGPTARKAVGAPKFDQNSVASTVDSYAGRSVQSSTNSRTGLLESNNNAARAGLGKRAPPADDDMPAVKRTQRRVKDPYAISDDEEDEENAATPTAPVGGKEESLVDFLNSVPPPQDGNPPPALNLSKSTIKEMTRRTSNAGAKARSAVPSASKISGNIRAAAAAAGGKTRSGSVAQEDDGAGRRSRAKPQFQARDERAEKSSTRELADFLNSASPPPGANQSDSGFPSSGSGNPGDAGFSRMFSRRRGKSGIA